MSDATYSSILVSHHRYFIAHSLVSLIFFVNKQWPTPNTVDTHFHAGPKRGIPVSNKGHCTATCAIVYLMVLYMKQWARWGSVLLSAIVSLFSGVSLAQ